MIDNETSALKAQLAKSQATVHENQKALFEQQSIDERAINELKLKIEDLRREIDSLVEQHEESLTAT